MDPNHQNKIFRHFLDTFERVVTDLKAAGKYDAGIVDCSGESIVIKNSTIIHTDADSGATAKHVHAEIDRGVSWQSAKERYEVAIKAGKQAHFIHSKNPAFGHARSNADAFIYGLAIGRSSGAGSRGNSRFYSLQKPNTGYAAQDYHISTLRDKYKFIDTNQLGNVERGWSRQYELYKHDCMHSKCHIGDGCGYGKRLQACHVPTAGTAH